jgi:hypothetical protein
MEGPRARNGFSRIRKARRARGRCPPPKDLPMKAKVDPRQIPCGRGWHGGQSSRRKFAPDRGDHPVEIPLWRPRAWDPICRRIIALSDSISAALKQEKKSPRISKRIKRFLQHVQLLDALARTLRDPTRWGTSRCSGASWSRPGSTRSCSGWSRSTQAYTSQANAALIDVDDIGYVMRLKDTQPTLRAELERLPRPREGQPDAVSAWERRRGQGGAAAPVPQRRDRRLGRMGTRPPGVADADGGDGRWGPGEGGMIERWFLTNVPWGLLSGGQS